VYLCTVRKCGIGEGSEGVVAVGVAAAVWEGFSYEVAVFVIALLKLSDEGDLIISIVGLQLIGDVVLFACGGESVAV